MKDRRGPGRALGHPDGAEGQGGTGRVPREEGSVSEAEGTLRAGGGNDHRQRGWTAASATWRVAWPGHLTHGVAATPEQIRWRNATGTPLWEEENREVAGRGSGIQRGFEKL